MAKEVELPAGVASKLYGVANFTETGMFARIGRAGLSAIKDSRRRESLKLHLPSDIRLSCSPTCSSSDLAVNSCYGISNQGGQ